MQGHNEEKSFVLFASYVHVLCSSVEGPAGYFDTATASQKSPSPPTLFACRLTMTANICRYLCGAFAFMNGAAAAQNLAASSVFPACR